MMHFVAPKNALYFSRVTHARVAPVKHAFSYRVFSLFLDIDRVDETAKTLKWFSHNAFNLFSLRDRDHGPRDGSPLRPWAEARFREAGVDVENGQIFLLCFPLLFGYAFNPISVYYGYNKDGRLAGVIYDVNSTFGETHAYVAAVELDGAESRHDARKKLFVSPFFDMSGEYAFQLYEPGDGLKLVIDYRNDSGRLLTAAMTGVRVDLTDANLLKALARHPLMTLKVIAGIHWEALRLILKGMKLHSRAPKPRATTSRATFASKRAAE